MALIGYAANSEGRGRDQCSPTENYGPPVPGKCDRLLPRSESRYASNIRLVCSSNVSHYLRQPFPISQENYDKWLELDDQAESSRDVKIRNQMQTFRQGLDPDITWSGSIPYQTIEKWSWVECYYGEAEICGVHYRKVKNSDGTTTEVKEVESCYHNESRSESRECSTETMTYNAHFTRYKNDEWGPAVEGYIDELYDKYTLLPAESEDVQVYNTSSSILSSGTILKPSVEVGDRWNQYTPVIRFDSGAAEEACRYNTSYHITVEMKTDHRIKRAPPNAFGLPHDLDGNELPTERALDWLTRGKDGEHLKPKTILLSDRSSTVIADMARHSRKFISDLEKARSDSMQNTNAPAHEVAESKNRIAKSKKGRQKGFMKDTRILIQLYEFPYGEFRLRRTHNLDKRSSEVITWRSPHDEYTINLIGDTSDNDLFRWPGRFGTEWIFEVKSIHLRPGRKYAVSLKQRQIGIWFYDEKEWSKPLMLWFTIDKDKLLDDRGFFEKKINWLGDASWKKPYTFFTDFW